MNDPWLLGYAIGVPSIGLLVVALTYRRFGLYWALVPIIFTIYFLISESAALGMQNYQYGPMLMKIDLWALIGKTPPPSGSACTQTSLGVPLSVVIMEGVLLFGMLRTTNFLQPPMWLRPLMDGLMAVTIDFILDPVVAKSLWCGGGGNHGSELHGGVGLWTWFTSPANPGQWFEIPLVNFMAWFVGAAAISWAVRHIAGRTNVTTLSTAHQLKAAGSALVLAIVAGLIVEGICFFVMGELLARPEVSGVQRWLVLLVVFGTVAVAIWLARDSFKRTAKFHWEVIALPVFLFAYMGWALVEGGPWPDLQALVNVYVVCAVLFFVYATAPYAGGVIFRYLDKRKEAK